MVRIEDIQVHSFSFEEALKRWNDKKPIPVRTSHYGELLNKQEKALRETFEMLGKDNIDFLPQNTQHKVEFIIKDSCTAFANALRRALIDETEVWSLSCDEFSSFKEYDKYMLSDFFRKQLEAIPISQDAKDYYDWEIEIDINNDTSETMPVFSSHIRVTNKKTKKEIDTKKLWEQNIHLAYLQSGYALKVSNIQIKSGQGKIDGNAFSHVSNVLYDVLDCKDSCMVSMPTSFLLGYDTHKNFDDPFEPIKKTLKYLQTRIEEIKTALPEKINGVYHSDVFKITTEGDYTTFTIFQDTWTLANLISRYIFDLDPEITYITADIEHPDKDVSIIKMNHSDVIKITQHALQKIEKDLKDVSNIFAKQK